MLARVHIPSLGGATEWLNSEPLSPAELARLDRPRGLLDARTPPFPGAAYDIDGGRQFVA